MAESLRIACYGMNGHQILGRLKDHPRARCTAVAAITDEAVRKSLGDEVADDVRVEKDLDALIGAGDVEFEPPTHETRLAPGRELGWWSELPSASIRWDSPQKAPATRDFADE